MALPDWLPDLIMFNDYGGDWNKYLQKLYTCFQEDFINRPMPFFNGIRLSLKKHPIVLGKEITFWHLISEGPEETNRIPDIRRCEKICWSRPIIENCNSEGIKIWDVIRKSERRTCIWFEDAEFVVIIAHRQGYSLLWTAYNVDQQHRKNKFNKEYKESLSKKG